MPCLEDASIDVKFFSDMDKSKTYLSAVRSLVLHTTDQVLLPFSTVKFSRLIKLRIYPDRSDWLEALLLLLKKAPKLKDLLVDYAFNTDVIPSSWNQPSSIAGCLSSHLEFFLNLSGPYLENQNLSIEELRDIPRASTFVEMIIVFDDA
ncbi:hypothetical protein Bca52824_093339 [Brassica carinata]|uniref:FBD domain-containing protein n=1 Tax=Brassica carinata TaxID=52824 RepID=A0A8X7P5A7_BRACI|nr:hypothetical protein Bca52824_093339 [Brassica carinata]